MSHDVFVAILLSTDLAADLGLSMFVWEAPCDSGATSKRCFLALFDMNRWYNAQMPFHIRSALHLLALHLACQVFLVSVKIVAEMTYNVLSGMLSLYTTRLLFSVCYVLTVGTSYLP